MKQEHARFCLDPAGDPVVERHLQILSERILALGISPLALILAGSFGRGEGVTRSDGAGRRVPVNDYDIVVLGRERLPYPKRRSLRRLCRELERERSICHIDLMPLTLRDLSQPGVKMIHYDIKFGSTVFHGPPEVLDSIPYPSDAEIPAREVQNLLINRLVTALEGHPRTRGAESPEHKARQIAKVYLAVTDSRIVAAGRYRTRYAEKLKCLETLQPSDATAATIVPALPWCRRAWSCELAEDQSNAAALFEHWDRARKLLVQEILVRSEGLDDRRYTASELIGRWRGSRQRILSGPGIWNLGRRVLQGKRVRSRVEQLLFATLSAYPEARTFAELGVRVPAWSAPTDGNGSAEWRRFADGLIADWYDS